MIPNFLLTHMILHYLILAGCSVGDTQKVYFYKSYGIETEISDTSLKIGQNASKIWKIDVHGHAYKKSSLTKRFWEPFKSFASNIDAISRMSRLLDLDAVPNFIMNIDFEGAVGYKNGFNYFDNLNLNCPNYLNFTSDCPRRLNSERQISLPPTDSIGHTRQILRIATNTNNNGKIVFRLMRQQCQIGEIYLIKKQGISIITDIDDTIRESNVICTLCFFRNTFGGSKFIPISGMPALFQKWNQNLDHPAFHYVSGIPWQWYTVYESFFSDSQFPEGPSHFQDVHFDQIKKFVDVKNFKIKAISDIISNFPQRKFLLLGDSGQFDPESYAAIFSKYPKSILCIWIRKAASSGFFGKLKARKKNSEKRFTSVFKDVPREKWNVFENVEEISNLDFSSGQCRP
eukprot:NODE_95_length_21511_cov_0.501168.p4 type:complete len:401 gc:universal NODE_95_length_21511_cov_0.501168:3499-4701(+)